MTTPLQAAMIEGTEGGAMAHILIVKDQKKLAASLRRGLEEEGFEADTAHTGEEGFYQATTRPPDALVLDIMPPAATDCKFSATSGSGFARPVLILTSRDAVEIGWLVSTAGRTTTWSSRSRSPNWWPGCGRC